MIVQKIKDSKFYMERRQRDIYYPKLSKHVEKEVLIFLRLNPDFSLFFLIVVTIRAFILHEIYQIRVSILFFCSLNFIDFALALHSLKIPLQSLLEGFKVLHQL